MAQSVQCVSMKIKIVSYIILSSTAKSVAALALTTVFHRGYCVLMVFEERLKQFTRAVESRLADISLIYETA